MRIAQIAIENLFGLFSYPLSLNLEDHITIIHGPNGCGKTTILRIIQSLFRARMQELSRIPFEKLEVVFDNGHALHVARNLRVESKESRSTTARPRQRSRQREEWEIEFRLSQPAAAAEQWRWVSRLGSPDFPTHMIDAHLPFLTRIDDLSWQDDRTEEILSLDDIVIRFRDALPFLAHLPGQEMPKWLRDTLGAIEVHFIQTQRLLRLPLPHPQGGDRRRSHSAMVLEYSEELKERIQRTLAQSVQESRTLDQTFPVRVLQRRPTATVSSEQIRKKYEDQQQKQKRLIGAGLLASHDESVLPYVQDVEQAERQMLWMYLEDTDRKLAVFDDFLGKIEVLTDMLNSRFLHKTLTIDREQGFVFRGAKDRRLIPIDALSSGEQHELVLTYELLFCVKPGSLILIDEPELSLHVGWQHRFLEDLKRISDLARLDFLVATHSPQIIHKRWDLAVKLAEDQD